MGLFSNKLTKLKITALKTSGTDTSKKYIEDSTNSIEVMFNPESYSLRYATKYEDKKGINTGSKEPNNFCSPPEELELKLVIDGTGVSNNDLLPPLQPIKVRDEVEKFLELTTYVNGETHKPNPVLVTWGEYEFQGTLSTVAITYPFFNRDAEPLRAELDVKFEAAVLDAERVKNLKSPDLTRFKMVTGSDNLLLMTASAYQDPSLYIAVAGANKLNNFRKLQTGASLRFPPIKE